MPHIIDNKVYHHDEKLGWIDGHHVRSEEEGKKLGYFDQGSVYDEEGHKVAYIHENELWYVNGRAPSSLEHINEEIEGNVPILEKCAIKVLFDL